MEIERKFLVKELPDLSGIKSIPYERYYLRVDEKLEERIQKKGDKYELETKEVKSSLERTKDKKDISKEEFEELKRGKENEGIIREGYNLSSNPNISIKIYHGKFEGLVRAEVEFKSTEESENYNPESWMGKEITQTDLGRDAKLLCLTNEEFQSLLKIETGN